MLISPTTTALLAGAFTLSLGSFLRGTSGDDNLNGTPASETLLGYAGNDNLYGGGGDDTYFGGPGNDFMADGDGDCCMHGGPGNDGLRGGPGNDFLSGGPGDDTIDLYRRADFGAPTTTPIETEDYDIGIGGSGDDSFTWASGLVYFVFNPLLPGQPVHGGDAFISGGSGDDRVLFGLGTFAAPSTSYDVRPGWLPGTARIESLESGAVLFVVGVEQLVFLDTTIQL